MEVSKRVGRPTLLLLIRGKTAGVPALSVRGGAPHSDQIFTARGIALKSKRMCCPECADVYRVGSPEKGDENGKEEYSG